jgi:hypothetical protein
MAMQSQRTHTLYWKIREFYFHLPAFPYEESEISSLLRIGIDRIWNTSHRKGIITSIYYLQIKTNFVHGLNMCIVTKNE